MNSIAFKPIKEWDKQIPENFEQLIITRIDDLEIQKTPSQWFSRNSNSIKLTQKSLTIGLVRYSTFFKGSVEVTVPKDYFIDKSIIELSFTGKGWASIKLIESTVTQGGVATYAKGTWQKLDSVKEKELIYFSETSKTLKIPIISFYNKPLNVSVAAFIKGCGPINKANIGSLELTVRSGTFTFHNLKIY